MGLLAKMATKEPRKLNLGFTYVRIVSLSDGKETTIRTIDAKYSARGDIENLIELPSFEGEYAICYVMLLKHYLDIARKVEGLLRTGQL